jgi:hypothetical protein
MPQAAAAAVVAWVGAVGAAASVVYAAVYIVVTMAINYGLNKLSQSLSGKRKTHGTGPARDVTVRGTVEPMQIINGEIKATGFLAFYGASGSANDYLHFVVCYAGHQCEDITDVWLDGRKVQDANIDGAGSVSTADFQDGGSKLSVFRHLGTKNQTVDTVLDAAFSVWGTNHRGAGVAYVHYRLLKSEKVWAAGPPSMFAALVKGQRHYDPRKDSTNGGSGSHRYTDATTWEYSNNATLVRRSYISGGSRWYDVATPEPRLGFNAGNERIDDEYTIVAANIDDESVAIPNGSGGSTTQARYTCDVQLSCGSTFKENLDILNSAAVGEVAYVNGKYRIHSGAYETPGIALDEDDFVGPVTVSTHPNGEDLYNFVTGTFYDDSREWSLSPFPNITNSSFEADDGGQYPRKIELPATRDRYRAQRIAMLHLAQSRHKMTVRFEKLTPKAMGICQHENFTSTIGEFGWSSKVFRCLDWEWLPDGWVAVTAREETSGAYADPDVADYAAPGVGTVETPQLDLPDTPLNFTYLPMSEGIFFRWDMPAPQNPRTIFRIYEHTASTPFSSATEVWSGTATSTYLERPGQTVRYYWIVAELNGQLSAATPVGAGLAAAPFVQGFDEVFADTFEHQDYARYYNVRNGTPTATYPTNGENGGRVLRFQNHGWIAWNKNIPYDPNGIYRFTVRARMVTAPTGGVSADDIFYAGLEGVAADGTTLINVGGFNSSGSQHYPTNMSAVDMGSVSLGTWVTFQSYFTGHSGSPGGGASITSPMGMYTGVRFVRPLLILNYANGNGIMEVDFIKLEKVMQTSQIASEAATSVYATFISSDDLSNVTGYGITVATLAIPTFDFDTEMVVTAQGSVSQRQEFAHYFLCTGRISDSDISGGPIGVPGSTILAAPPGVTTLTGGDGAFNIEASYVVAANTSKTFYFTGAPTGSADDDHMYLNNVLFKVEVIKR